MLNLSIMSLAGCVPGAGGLTSEEIDVVVYGTVDLDVQRMSDDRDAETANLEKVRHESQASQ